MAYRDDRFIKTIRKKGGLIRTADSIKMGFYSGDLSRMVANGLLEKIDRGLYRDSGSKPHAHDDVPIVSLKIPRGIICLISALSFHDITTQIPHAVYVALPHGFKRHKIGYPPVKFFWFSQKAHEAGVQEHVINGVKVKIYSPEKTVADCFKFRNKIGADVAVEALKNLVMKRKAKINDIITYAKINRVEKIIRPYLETLL